MKTNPSFVLLLVLLLFTDRLQAQGTAFTYQGRLNDGANLANGNYDLRFAIYDALTLGTPQGSLVTNVATSVSNGLFTVTLDFGNQFPGANRWLEIGVRSNGTGNFFTLSPRQALTPAPYAITAGNLISGGLASGTYGNAVTFNNANNSFSGSFNGNGANVTNVNAVTLNGLTSSNFWKTAGNNLAPGQFFGSTNNQPVEVWANNQRVAQLAYASNSASGYSPNLIFGNEVNTALNTVVGATIVGGGTALQRNSVVADFGSVVGGSGNSASGIYAVAMGGSSQASGLQSIAVGGSAATADYTMAMGNSSAGGKYSSALGSSTASGRQAFASGLSTASGQSSTAIGGTTASGFGSTAIGAFALANGDYATALGQSSATNLNATATGASTAGGTASLATGASLASGDFSTATGNSTATNSYAVALGNSFGNGYAATALGNSVANGAFATALGGSSASGAYATASGSSTAGGNFATALGNSTVANGFYSFAGGHLAQALHTGSLVWADSQAGIFSSTANDQFCIRAQGGVQLNPTTSLYFGSQTRQMLNLWGVNYGIGIQNNREYFRSDGGFAWFLHGFHSDTMDDAGSGGSELMTLTYQVPSNAGADCGLFVGTAPFLHVKGYITADANIYCSSLCQASDRNLKENFMPVNSVEILNKVACLPITQWNYKKEARVEHVGPMAQDFYAAFNVGPDDEHITTVDEGGVALAAIQGLNQKVEELKKELHCRDTENMQLKARLESIEKILERTSPNNH